MIPIDRRVAVKFGEIAAMSLRLAAEVARLKDAGVRFRNDIVAGPGGKQVVIEDPSGNPVELFQPAAS